jgi:hypothetical protein
MWAAGAALGVRSQNARRDRVRGDGVVAEDLDASSREVGNRLAVCPVGHGAREQAAHHRVVVVGEVSVRLAGRHRSGVRQGERGERRGMVEGGHLGDHPADADAGEVRRPAAQCVDKGRGISGESRSV